MQTYLCCWELMHLNMELELLLDKYPDGKERPVAYASRQLTTAERNYSLLEKEALRIIFVVHKFHFYLYGRRFTLVTDHQPLSTIFGSHSAVRQMTAARLQRWTVILSAYVYDIQFRGSKENICADALSRLPLPLLGASNLGQEQEQYRYAVHQISSLPMTAERIAKETRRDNIESSY